MSTESWDERMKVLQERLEGLNKRDAISRQRLLLQIHLLNLENERKQ